MDAIKSKAPRPPAPAYPRPVGRYREQYGVIVLCQNARDQEAVYNRLRRDGLTCKVVCT